eukprot:NODE_351_length_10383_cov_0.336153.p5 type:complete len:271 gc:universal NODE_351_length_10383_cov_0.336153:7470-8282(+)
MIFLSLVLSKPLPSDGLKITQGVNFDPSAKDAQLVTASTSGGRVCGINSYNEVSCGLTSKESPVNKKGVYNDFEMSEVDGKLQEISLFGANACGISSKNNIFCTWDIDCAEPKWTQMNGKLDKINIDGDRMCGVTQSNQVYCSRFMKNEWQLKSGLLKDVSISGAKACGVTLKNDLACTENIDDEETEWNIIGGTFTQADLNSGIVCGVKENSVTGIFCAPFNSKNFIQYSKDVSYKYVTLSNSYMYAIDLDNNVFKIPMEKLKEEVLAQ